MKDAGRRMKHTGRENQWGRWEAPRSGGTEAAAAATERMTYDGDDDDDNYFGYDVDEVDTPASWRRPLMQKSTSHNFRPPDSCMAAHQSAGLIINTFSVKALSWVKFNGAPGK